MSVSSTLTRSVRADIHTLFDLGRVAVHPVSLAVMIDRSLTKTAYADLAERRIHVPADLTGKPSSKALKKHCEIWGYPLSE